MAFMNQEKKRIIAAELKKVVPADWRYSLSVNNSSTIVMTIKSAPVNLMEMKGMAVEGRTYHQLNQYYPEQCYEGKTLNTMIDIIAALNTGNWNRSDSQSDYFDVGHYVNVNIGSWDKPFKVEA